MRWFALAKREENAMNARDGKKMRRILDTSLLSLWKKLREGNYAIVRLKLRCIACSSDNELEAGGYAVVEMLLATTR